LVAGAACVVAGFACAARFAVCRSGVTAKQNATTRDVIRLLYRTVMNSSFS
jgi:hypothetical protein